MANNTFFPPVQGQFIFDETNYSNQELLPVVEQPPKRIFTLNQILYGVSGTGKTYITRKYAVSISANKKIDDAKDILHEYSTSAAISPPKVEEIIYLAADFEVEVHGVDLFNILNLRGLLNGRQENLLIDRIKSETKN